MKINIICVGKIKEDYIKSGIAEFAKRISAYAELAIVELREQNDYRNINEIIEKESKEIIETIDKYSGFNILLDIGGKSYSSERFAAHIAEITTHHAGTMNFIIGGSYGVNSAVRERADYRLSFSPMTFPHQLMRLILTEQIYRALAILNNSKYHK